MVIQEITDAESRVIQLMREARPFEKIEIVKDKDGKPDTYFIHRIQKMIFKEILIIPQRP